MVTRLIVINFVMYTNVNHCVVHLKLIQCISTRLFLKEETIKFNNFIALIFEIYFGFYAEIENYVVMAFTETQ